MTRPPLRRACHALRVPIGLLISDIEIRAALRHQHVGTERLVLALADMFEGVNGPLCATDAWMFADVVVRARGLPAAMIGALALAAMLPEEGTVDPDELGLWVEAAP